MRNFIKYLMILCLFYTSQLKSQQQDLPIIFIHGMLASGDTYANFHHYLVSDGYPADRIRVLDWNTLNQNNGLALLGTLVDKVLEATGSKQVVLVGHSAGGGLSFKYMDDIENAQKVSKYIHIGSFKMNALPGGELKVPTLNIYSAGDLIARGGDIEGAVNVKLENLDHYEVATSMDSYSHIKKFLEIQTRPVGEKKSESVKYSGRVLSLGENKALANIEIKVSPLNAKGKEKSEEITIKTDADGYWPTVSLLRERWYEFTVYDPVRTIKYYCKAMHDNPLFYLRTLPPPGTMAAMMLSGLPSDPESSLLAIFFKDKAAILGRDQIMVNGTNLSTESLIKAQNSTIALFLYDDGDSVSSGNLHSRFAAFPFLKGADVYLPSKENNTLQVEINDESLTLPAIPSDQAIQILVW